MFSIFFYSGLWSSRVCFLLFILVSWIYLTNGLEILNQDQCGNTEYKSLEGTIISPNYPASFELPTICEWRIYSPPNSILKINVVDLDIEQDGSCAPNTFSPSPYPCCTLNWLSLPMEGGRGTIRLCGSNLTMNPISVSQRETEIKYFASNYNSNKNMRGFKITYSIDIRSCQLFDLQCSNGKCVSNSTLCNGVDDCGDQSDEKNCVFIHGASKVVLDHVKDVVEPKSLGALEPSSMCSDGRIRCTFSPNHCYSQAVVCDGKFDCPKGEDEVSCSDSCPGQIKCSSGDGCYTPVQRCNSVRNCRDNSDETGCPEEPCGPLQFVCLNGACVSASALCDGNDDCGDLSDEENCTKNSLMTAAIMGLLACVFLFVVGLGCLYRLYSVRVRASTAFMQQLEPDPIDEDFMYREPPPAYSVAVNDPRVITYPSTDMTERFFENDPPPRNHRACCPRRNRRRSRTTSSDNNTRSRPRSSNTFPNSPGISLLHGHMNVTSSEVADHSNPKINECKFQTSTSSAPNIHCSNIELGGLAFQNQNGNDVSTSSRQNDSPCSSPSLSPSRESVTSSTSLEDQEELVQTCHS